MTTDANAGGNDGAGSGADAAAAAAAAASGGGQQQAAWHGLTDQADVEYITNKGWQSPVDLYKSYRGAERMLGKNPNDLVMRPKDGDVEGWNGLYDKLGRPPSADKYDLTGGLPEGAKPDTAFATKMAGAFHKIGLTEAQAKELAAVYNAEAMSAQTQSSEDARAALAADKAQLLKDWGGGYERMMNAAQTAVAALGFTAAEVDALEGAIGYRGVMTKMAELGKKLGETPLITGDKANQFSDTMTPAEAKQQIETLKMDKDFGAALRGGALHPGRKAAMEKWSRLHEVAYGSERIN